MGKVFHDDMASIGINAHLSEGDTTSGRVIALISPDTERTFATYLGAAVELDKDDLSPGLFSRYDVFHIEGYIVQDHDLLETALKLARKNKMLVSLDLASYNIVEQNRDFLEDMLRAYVDIVFANEDEARSLTGKEPGEALDLLAGLCNIAVVKLGKYGSLVKRGHSKFEIGILPVKSVDTTGAGDLYAAGFLYGMVKNFSLEQCGNIGAILAGKVIEIVGSKIREERWKEIKRMIVG
jgi:sugar/nucleoside kinase (ribokinase family)